MAKVGDHFLMRETQEYNIQKRCCCSTPGNVTIHKPPLNRCTTAPIPLLYIILLYLSHEKDTTHFTPFEW